MRIFFTGATGLVGTAIAESFSHQPFEITAVSRQHREAVNNINWIRTDISAGTEGLGPYIQAADIIVHNAACLYKGDTAGERDAIQKINIGFTQRLLELAENGKTGKIIFTGSFSVFTRPLPSVITEESTVNPSTFYAESKLKGEQMIKDYAEKKGIQYIVLRISSPVSCQLENMPATVIKKWIHQSTNGEPIPVFGRGSRTQNFVSVKDVAQAFVNSVHSDAAGIFNIASETSLSMEHLAKLITQKFRNEYYLTGEDANENDRWNISIEKAGDQLGYSPRYDSEEAILELLNAIK